MHTPKLASIIILATFLQLGLAVLGWGGFGAFFSHPALIAVAIATIIMFAVALFTSGNLSPGERENRANRWVLIPFGALGLLIAYLPARTDRIGFGTLDGDAMRWVGLASRSSSSAGRCASGPCLCSAASSAVWSPSSLA
jgi:hypothetical protein